MSSEKIAAGALFPEIEVSTITGEKRALVAPTGELDWQLIVVYRGLHCPLCIDYLATLNNLLPKFNAVGADVLAVSADPEEKAQTMVDKISPKFSLGYGLTQQQMRSLGLYISEPHSPKETDRPFAEPALFVVNANNQAHLIDLSNAPFIRPDLNSLLMGLNFIRNPNNNYPIRGTL